MTFLETADRIGARLCRDAIWWRDRCNWIGSHSEPGLPAVHVALGPSLYSGASGIALTLSHLYAATGERIYRATAEAALRTALSRLDPLRAASQIGFHDGLAGIAYAAHCAASIMGEECYALQCLEIARALEPDEKRLDIINGSAGVIPVLLALGRNDLAARHAHALIAAAHRTDSGWSWGTMDRVHGDLTGFAHGAAGIAFALLEAFHATADPAFRDAAIQGFRYEASVYDPERENWPDFRFIPENGLHPCAVMWCAGAPGIGLSRLRAWQLLCDPSYRDEALTAIRTTSRWLGDNPNANYSLCHGHAGNAELLLSAGRILNDDAYSARARETGKRGIEAYERPQIPWPCGNRTGEETPELMLGLAGIAHFYLRLHDAEKFPSVLMQMP